jgi:predicted nucleic acid-binding protein
MAVQALIQFAEQDLVLHPLTAAETLVGQVKLHQEQEFLDSLEAVGIAVLSGDIFSPIELARVRASSNLKMPDAVVVATALKTDAEMLSFDEVLGKRAESAGVVPAKIIPKESESPDEEESAERSDDT